MIKKLLFTTLALALSLVGPLAYAQEMPAAGNSAAPEVYARNLRPAKDVYKAGETLSGTFQLINGSQTGISDVVYRVMLGSALESNGMIATIYDTKTYPNTVFLGPNERKDVAFTYTLPNGFSGSKLNLRVQAYLKSGIPLGWADFPIKVTGGTPLLTLNRVALAIDGKSFTVQTGPMIYPGKTKTATLDLAVTNPTANTITVSSHIKIYDRTDAGKLLKEYTATTTAIKSKAKLNLSIPLETFNGTPGVYLGDISLIDASNTARVQPIQFRYIVAGTIVNITSVTAGKTTIAKGDSLPITVNYSGTPFDITNPDDSIDSSATLDVKIFNEHDVLVGKYSDTTNFNSGTSKTINITSESDARALRAEVTATKDGKVLAMYATKLTANYDQARQQAVNEPATSNMKVILYAILGVVILLVIIILIIRFINMRRGATLMIFFALLFTMAFGNIALAFTETGRTSYNGTWDYTGSDFMSGNYPTQLNSQGQKPNGYQNPNGDGSKWHITHCHLGVCDDLSPQVTINSPGSIDVFTPGQTFNLVGSAYAIACINNPQNMNITATFNGTTQSHYYTDVNDFSGTAHYSTQGGTSFSIGTFTAPSTPGTYQLTFRIDSYYNVPTESLNKSRFLTTNNPATGHTYGFDGATLDHYTNGGYVTGTVTIVVGSPAPTVTITASPNPIDPGSASTLTWTTTNNPTSCVASDGWSGSVSTAGGSQSTGAIYVTTKYTIKCTNAAGSDTQFVVVSVNACVGSSGGGKNLAEGDEMNAAAAILAQASPSPSGGGGEGGGGGSLPCGPNPPNTNPPAVSIYANPNPVNSGSPTTLTWYSNNADICTSPNFNTGNQTNNSVGFTTPTLNAQASYSITCTNNTSGLSANANVTVNVAQNVTASCRPTTAGHDPATATTVNTAVIWKTTITGGYTSVQWMGTDIPGGATGDTYTLSYTTVGKKNASIQVTQTDNEIKTFSCSIPVDVKPPQVFREI
jgi:hypothetical protein